MQFKNPLYNIYLRIFVNAFRYLRREDEREKILCVTRLLQILILLRVLWLFSPTTGRTSSFSVGRTHNTFYAILLSRGHNILLVLDAPHTCAPLLGKPCCQGKFTRALMLYIWVIGGTRTFLYYFHRAAKIITEWEQKKPTTTTQDLS